MKKRFYIVYLTLFLFFYGYVFAQSLSQPTRWGNINGNITNQQDLVTYLLTTINDPANVTTTITNYNNNTILVSRSSMKYIRIYPTNNYTLAFDINSYPTNVICEHAIELVPNGYSTTFDPTSISTNDGTNIIPGSAGVSISTNQSNLLIFMKCSGWSLFGMKGQ
jgi:hypothetical protein